MQARTVIENGVIPTLCRQCDMRCTIQAHIVDNKIVKISGLKSHPHSQGRVCPKALAAPDLIYHPDRLQTPLKKKPDGSFAPITYDRAMDEIAAAMTKIKQDHGARAMGAWTGEAIGFFQQEGYARRFIHAFGSPNYFSAESVCYASRHIAYHLIQGYYNACPDFAHARTIVVWGANLGHTHPPYQWDIKRARQKGARMIVIDPRRTAAARKADLFVKIIPGSDAALAWGIVRELIAQAHYDHDFVTNHSVGFEQMAAYARQFTPEVVTRETGISRDQFDLIVKWIAEGRPRVAQYAGISLEHQVNGLNTVRLIGMLSGLCGAVDHEGGDIWPVPAPIRSLSLYDELPLVDQDPIGRDQFPALYHFRQQCHSIRAMDYMLGHGPYPLRGLIITGANPVLTNPNAAKVTRALGRLGLLVVRDLFLTATAREANYVLPAASFLERSEVHYYGHRQSLGLSAKVVDFPGVTDEFTFWRDLADRLGLAETYFPWESETEVNQWILAPAGEAWQNLADHPEGYVYAPLKYQKYRERPFPTPSGKFEFASGYLKSLGHDELPVYVPPAVRPASNSSYPLVLITGARHPLYYHSRFRNIARFRRANGRPEVEIHPGDAAELGIRQGEMVRVATETGTIAIAAAITNAEDTLPGIIQIGHGWDEANVNLLSDDGDLDPISGYPNLKIIPARIGKMQN